jgi:hypothetical protein
LKTNLTTNRCAFLFPDGSQCEKVAHVDDDHCVSIPIVRMPHVGPKSKAEYEAAFHANERVTGYGINVTIHMPCPFCAAPEFIVYRVLEVVDALAKGAVCTACNRGMKGITVIRDAGTSTEFVQTCGDPPPPWVVAMRRTEEL